MVNPAPIILAASQAAKYGIKGLQKTQELAEQSFKYDFTGLVTGLVIIFVFAKVIEIYVQIASGLASAWINLLKFFGFQVPANAPQPLVQLVNEGFSGIKYWDLIKGLMMLIIGLEWLRYKDQLSYAGHGAFAMMLGFFGIITIPGLFQKLRENQLITQ